MVSVHNAEYRLHLNCCHPLWVSLPHFCLLAEPERKDMSLSLISGWIFVEKRNLFQVFPEPVKKAWNVLELRVMVLVSLSLQICLIFFGSRRKHITNYFIRFIIYSSYLMADWVAIVALGVISNIQSNDDCNSCGGDTGLAAFWAPFLLLHLGGPDTITAYALADNDLWIRHLIGLIVQAAVTLYITLMAWQNTWLSYLTIPIFIAGIFKYGERTWVLRYSNREKSRQTLLSNPDQGDFVMFTDEFSLKHAQGYQVAIVKFVEIYIPPDDLDVITNEASKDGLNIEKEILLKAYSFFHTFKRLFVDIIVVKVREAELGLAYQSQSFLRRHGHKTAFKVIAAELGFAYDVLYTKAPLIYTRWGFVFRFVTWFFTFSVLMVFSVIIALGMQKHNLADLVITFILLGGAIVLEIGAVISLLSSDWTNLWLGYGATPVSWSKTPFLRAILCLRFHWKSEKTRWSKTINQYNLLTFCIHHRPFIFEGIIWSYIPLYKRLRSSLNYILRILEIMKQRSNSKMVTDKLEGLIFEHFVEMSQSDTYVTSPCSSRGRLILEKHGFSDQLDWMMEFEFDHRLIIWHIATDICFHLELGSSCSTTVNNRRSVSKQLSDYMLYILVMRPWVMPLGIGFTRFRDTCAEANKFFEDRTITSPEAACKILSNEMTMKINGKWSESVLYDACKLSRELQKMENGKCWEVISDVWVELMGYAASQCIGYDHVQLLEKGGELLSHVWLLMVHLSIAEQFQISYARARADFIVM